MKSNVDTALSQFVRMLRWASVEWMGRNGLAANAVWIVWMSRGLCAREGANGRGSRCTAAIVSNYTSSISDGVGASDVGVAGLNVEPLVAAPGARNIQSNQRRRDGRSKQLSLLPKPGSNFIWGNRNGAECLLPAISPSFPLPILTLALSLSLSLLFHLSCFALFSGRLDRSTLIIQLLFFSFCNLLTPFIHPSRSLNQLRSAFS
jgi:hypothetical protein